MQNIISAIAATAIALGLPAALVARSHTPSKGIQAMSTQAVPLAQYESQVKRFKPEQGLAAANHNDVRLFLYEWFTHFEHASTVDYYLSHLDNKNMSAAFPGAAPLTSHADFSGWYANLLAQTRWNFHDLSAIQVQQTAPQQYLVSFVIDWYGEVRADSSQRAGWQSRKDSNLYHHTLRQTWAVKAGDRFIIEKLVVTPGNTPSPITE